MAAIERWKDERKDMKGSIVVVDDMPDMLKLLEKLIKDELDVEARTAGSGEKAIEMILKDPASVVLADIMMPGMNGVELLQRIREIDSSTIVIMMTAYGSIEDAVETLKLGAYDYITKPFDEERLLHILKKALDYYNLIKKSIDLERKIKEKETVESFVGKSPLIHKLLETIRVVAKTDLTVLIEGETGTGKDLAARMIHQLSNRVDRPFVPVNCPAIPENILESELFGYKKGAFTGATHDKKGLFEAANGGTIFLDEIGDLPHPLQAKLLRVLEEKEIKPLGEAKTYKVDVRVISSTNRNLKEKITNLQFREDLYHRLNVVSISTPSLAEIPEDIPLISDHYLFAYCSEYKTSSKRFSEDTLKMLISRKWSGNVRELQNEIRKAVLFTDGEIIRPQDFRCDSNKFPLAREIKDGLSKVAYKEARKNLLEGFNVKYISELLMECNGNVSLAAKKADLERQSLQHLMRKYGINSEAFRNGANKM